MSRNILIVGRGTAGVALAQDIRSKGEGEVVGFLDDISTEADVLGGLDDVNAVIESAAVDLVYFAIPSVDAPIVRRFIGSIARQTVDIAIVPRTYAILTKETVDIDDLTDVDVLDLVGREPVKHDLISSTRFVEGKTVVVTGAAGSIGSRLVKHLVGMNAERIVCVDWWENGMFYLGQELSGAAPVSYHVADVKNSSAIDRIFATYRPDIVFHAAAYKHVPLMQSNPLEAINNNVGGTLNLMELATARDVANFVLVSTDKAVNPVNVMGATKRLSEMIMDAVSADAVRTRFNAVRFGNVIQSNGSVMQTFRAQLAARRPLTVTHEEITRFFMTIDEASQLIIQSAFVGSDGDIFVLDMGEPVKILDLARSLVNAVAPEIGIEIVGLRPGEKMFEELSYEPDRVGPTQNPKIFVVEDAGTVDGAQFMAAVRRLLADAGDYGMTVDDAINALRSFGFALHDSPQRA